MRLKSPRHNRTILSSAYIKALCASCLCYVPATKRKHFATHGLEQDKNLNEGLHPSFEMVRESGLIWRSETSEPSEARQLVLTSLES